MHLMKSFSKWICDGYQLGTHRSSTHNSRQSMKYDSPKSLLSFPPFYSLSLSGVFVDRKPSLASPPSLMLSRRMTEDKYWELRDTYIFIYIFTVEFSLCLCSWGLGNAFSYLGIRKWVTGLQSSPVVHSEGNMPELWNDNITTVLKLFSRDQGRCLTSWFPAVKLRIWGSYKFKCMYPLALSLRKDFKGKWGKEKGEEEGQQTRYERVTKH